MMNDPAVPRCPSLLTVKPILLTGATGFVGQHLYPVLADGRREVRCLSRRPEEAQAQWPGRLWVQGDVGNRESLQQAMEGCGAAYYLVHGMGQGSTDFRREEVEAARRFAAAAEASGLERIIYLGGVAPAHHVSEHLRSRLEVGEALRAGPVPALELRASMIVGHGSLSWLIVRDLAARLPGMILPRWLRSRTEPVAIDDVVIALRRALDMPLARGEWFDIPGPDVLTGREVLEITAQAMSLHPPIVVEVPVLTPWLSSWWVRLVTRADWAVAREVVVGLQEDLLAHDDRYWSLIGHLDRSGFRDAAMRAIAADEAAGPVTGFWGALERAIARSGTAPGRE